MDAEDRITALPDSLIHHILSLLPMREVIQTSILSSRWRYLWTSVPSLDFGTWRNEEEGDSDSEAASIFISHTLMRYRIPKVQKFRVHFNFTPSCQWNVDSWVHFSVAHDVEELELNLLADQLSGMSDDESTDDEDMYSLLTEGSNYLYDMPNLLFDCRTLVVLRLMFCELKFRSPLCLCSLKALELNHVGLNGLDTSGCPLLEDVILCKCGAIGSFTMFAPSQNIKYLKIYNFFSKTDVTIDAPHLLCINISGNLFSGYRIKDASAIRKAALHFKADASVETAKIMNILESLSHASSIKLCGMCLQVIFTAEKNFNKVLPISSFALELDAGLNKFDLPGMVYLLRSSQNIASLTLNIAFQEDLALPQGSKYWKILEYALSSNLQLKHVKINNFLSSACISSARFTGEPRIIIKRLLRDCEMEIKLVIMILQKCKMLNELQIFCTKDPRLRRLSFWSDIIQVMQKTLLGFQKASADVQICIS